MLRSSAIFLLALLAQPLHAQEQATTPTSPVAALYAQAITEGCLPVATGSAVFGGAGPADDQEAMVQLGFEYGISDDIYDRFGLQGRSVLNRAVMGYRSTGENVFVLALGGALPGCKVILLSPEDAPVEDAVAGALAALTPTWRELPFANTRAGSSVSMRRFIMRDGNNTPFLINLITSPPIPDSEMRLLATLSPIPANVQIPEGY